MDEIIKKNKMKNVWKYVLFVFAFICCGFTFNSIKANAAPVVSIPTDNDFKYDEGITFYVGYDVFTAKSINYRFNDGSWTSVNVDSGSKIDSKTCSSVSYIDTCSGVVLRYKIAKSSLPKVSPNTSYSDTSSNGKFKFEVKSSNFTGETSKSTTLTYDGQAPTINKITINRNDTSTNTKFKIGDVVKFSIELSESSFVSSGVGVSFKIGSTSKSASCGSSTSSSVNILNCTYKIVSGDSGSFSSFSVTGATKIKDLYNNSISSSTISVSSITNSSNLTVDGVKPYITNISSVSGVFTSDDGLQVQVTFSESIVASAGSSAPTLTIKVGEGINRTCSFNSGAEKNLVYICKVGNDDQGKLAFVSIAGGSGFSDSAGNSLNLSTSSATISLNGTSIDNNLPTLDSVTITSSGCSSDGDTYYCQTGNTVTISFNFNMNVTFTSKNISLLFSGVNAKNSFTQSNPTQKKLEIKYTISDEDDGKLGVSYSFNIKGDNGKTSSFSNTKEFEYYVDNASPVLDSANLEVYVGEEKFTGSIIYTGPNTEIMFKIGVVDASSVRISDSTRIYLVDENNNVINACSTCNIKDLTKSITDNVLTVKFIINSYFKGNVKLKVESSSLQDAYNNTLENDYISSVYTIDSNAPEFSINVIYPEYQKYVVGNDTYVVGGNAINFSIISENVDLIDFCITSSENEDCDEYVSLSLNTTYKYEFDSSIEGEHSLYVRVRDNSLSESVESVTFNYKDMFSYSNGIGAIANMHSIEVDVSSFDNGTNYKYGWFKKGNSVNFANANVTSKQDDSIVIDGNSSFYGEYRVCINRVSDNVILCSEYVNFDTKIDSFEVNVQNTTWTNENVATNIVFNDVSTIKCIAIGKNVSDINCNSNNSDVNVYKTSQAISPFTQYEISENGIYYFYIEDAIGNSQLISKTVTNIDRESIAITIYNGSSEGYNENLEANIYKSAHKFLVTFDKDASEGSTHKIYKYFFTTSAYTIANKDSYDSYYLKNADKGEVTNGNKSLNVVTPSAGGTYNLYIMAEDNAGNVSFASLTNIKVDITGPVIKMYDANNVETSGGSVNYISVFDYNIVISDYDSKLDLNKVYYRWVESVSNSTIFEKKYDSCPFDYNTCTITGDNIEFEQGSFNPSKSYKLEVIAYDNAGNASKFTTSSYKIDTTAPVISSNINQSSWYNISQFSFSVSKENNAGTLSNIAYCLNDCLTSDNYDLKLFKVLSVTNPTVENKTVTLALKEGVNTFVVYASDVFGNYVYQPININYDSVAPKMIVNNINGSGNVDLSGKNDTAIDFVINDEASGIKEYCIYLEEANKNCYSSNGVKKVEKRYSVSANGLYFIEIEDVSGNSKKYGVNVIGIDTDAISFDLVNSVGEGKFTNASVTISVANMRKASVSDVESRVRKIDYVALDYNSTITNYDSLFSGVVNNIYDKEVDSHIITSFSVLENGLYVVRIIDTADNVSYNYLKVNNIDKVSPFIDTNTYGDGSEKIYVSASNMRVQVDGNSKIYKYSNDTLKVNFGSDSLKDQYNGFNNYLGIKVCFEDSECVYNTYTASYKISEGYLVNNSVVVNAPYNFSGVIRYYLVDGAGNESNRYYFNVEYQNETNDIEVSLKNDFGNVIDSTKEYNAILINFSGEEVNDIINNNGLKYVLKKSNINMQNEFANRNGTVDNFLNEHGFITATSSNNNVVTISGVDDSYYVWVFIKDLLNNYKLIKVDTLVNLDTIAPTFDEIGLSINKIDSSNYDLVVSNMVAGYKLYIDSDNNGVYEEVTLTDNKYSFSVSGVTSVIAKLEDEAGNMVEDYLNLNLTNNVYARVYQLNNELKANVVVYNLGSKRVTSFRYIMTGKNSSLEFTKDSINDDNIPSCSGYEDTCKSSSYTNVSTGVYQISLSVDKKVTFYIYVDGTLIDLVTANIFVDNEAPSISYAEFNPNLISTKNGSYTFGVTIKDDNILASSSNKYMLTANSSINIGSFESYYGVCVNSDSCARGTFEENIVINSNDSQFSSLHTGNYYLYVYAVDSYSNANVVRSSVITVDNDLPVISYSIKDENNSYQSYKDITNELFIGSAAKIRFVDANFSYFEIYTNDTLSVKCNVNGTEGEYNCVKNSDGEIGFVVENGNYFYYLDNGNYTIKAYDSVSNVKEVYINVDNGNPVINLYKKVNENYELQNSSTKVFNDLSGLYINVNDNNFNYLTIDLTNTKTNETIKTVVRYSYNSDIGKCLYDISVCEHGQDLASMLSVNTVSYNKIIVNVYDKANRYSVLEINYDDDVPSIWTMNVNESIYIGEMLYVIEEGMVINVEIGVNENMTLDNLLEKVILDIDGMSYLDVKDSVLFSLEVYKDGSLFTGELLSHIGEYSLVIKYRDEAGNIATPKTMYINVTDNVDPELAIIDSSDKVEVNQETELMGINASDNYGLEVIDTSIVKNKHIGLDMASCSAVINGEVVECSNYVVKVSDNIYKFIEKGEYTFIYTVSDLSGNISTITQVINASDITGPIMSSTELASRTIEIGERKSDNSLNVDNISFVYPTSYDAGDDSNKEVTYLGLFSINNMKEKYKLLEDEFIVSDANNVLTYKFSKVGTYYLRFSSSDISGNASIFEYEIKVVDVIAPVISGIEEGFVVEVDLGKTFNANEDIIEAYSVVASDNYDSNVKIYYELRNGTEHTYEVVLSASDSSNNTSSILVYVDVQDNEAPISGELQLIEKTNLNQVTFTIVGGEDNSNNFSHEYRIEGMNENWKKYSSDSVLEFQDGLSKEVKVCVRAVDFAGNYSKNISCKTIIVDTKAPVIEGVRDGGLFDTEKTVTVSDDRLESVQVLSKGELRTINIEELPIVFNEVGTYSIIAKDSLGNESIVNFAIDTDIYVDIANDINLDNYSVTSIEFDTKNLIKANVSYDDNGNSAIRVYLNDLNVNENDMVYILGLVPNTNHKFVMFSLNGANISQYQNGVDLISGDNYFKDGVTNEDCFLKINDSYYAYVAIKEEAYNAPVVVEKEKENKDSSKTLKTVFIVAGSLLVVLVGYQIIKFKKRVRAA